MNRNVLAGCALLRHFFSFIRRDRSQLFEGTLLWCTTVNGRSHTLNYDEDAIDEELVFMASDASRREQSRRR